MPQVSIIIPVYNVGKYLERNINGLLNQTLKDIEIIYVDDCSSDDSLSILREYEQKYTNIKVVALEKNSGAAIARNRGLEVATGEYLGFVDPDDDIDLNYYEELYKKAKEDDADVVKCRRKNINIDGSITYNNIDDEISEKGKYYFTYEWTTAIYRASMIFENNIRFPEECVKAQDIVFLNRVICKTNRLSLIDNVYYNYYKREGSLNASKISLEKIKSAILAHRIILNNYNETNMFLENKEMYLDLYLRMYNSFFHVPFQNDSIDAKELCAKALIDLFYNCKDLCWMEDNYPVQNIVNIVKSKDVEKLTKVLSKCNSYKKLTKYNEKFIDNIFSIKDAYNKKHKVLTLLGIRLKIKNLLGDK